MDTPAVRAASGRFWLVLLGLVLLALATRLVHLDKPAHFDELYHVLAAQSWLTDGTFQVVEGAYTRARLFTILVSGTFHVLGQGVEAARLPSVIAGTLLVGAVFLWTRAVAGLLAAGIAALLLCLSPEAIGISQFARFYALHGLLFWLAAIGIYALFERHHSGAARLGLAAASVFCLLLALHLQVTTLIGLAGILIWVLLAVSLPWLYRGLAPVPIRLGLLAGILVVLVGAASVLLATELGGMLLAQYRAAPLWNQPTQDAFWYYHLQFLLDYPTLWPLLPVAALVALAARPRAAGFCLCVFATTFVLHSFAGAKAGRYVYYVLPFLFVLWGMALAGLYDHLRGFLVETADGVFTALGARRPWPSVRRGLIGLALAFLVFANTASVKTVAMLLDVRALPVERSPDWEAARPALQPWLDDEEAIVVTTRELQTLYYLGRYDLAYSQSRRYDFEGQEFEIDPRTGRPVIGQAATLAEIIACYPKGLIIVPQEHWRNPVQLDDAAANLIEQRMQPLELTGRARDLRAYSWSRRDSAPPADRCPELVARIADGSAAAPTAETWFD